MMKFQKLIEELHSQPDGKLKFIGSNFGEIEFVKATPTAKPVYSSIIFRLNSKTFGLDQFAELVDKNREIYSESLKSTLIRFGGIGFVIEYTLLRLGAQVFGNLRFDFQTLIDEQRALGN